MKFVLSSSRGLMGIGDLCRVPPEAARQGRAGQSSGRDRVGIVEEFCGYRARRDGSRGKFVQSRNPEYKTSGVAMWLNVVLTPS